MQAAPITIRKYTDFDEIKADEYRYWQGRPAHERLDALDEMIETAYALKGWEIEPDAPRLQRPFVQPSQMGPQPNNWIYHCWQQEVESSE